MYVWSKRLEFWLIAIAVLAIASSGALGWWSADTERQFRQYSLRAESAYDALTAIQPESVSRDDTRWGDQTRERRAFLVAGTMLFLGMVALSGVFVRRLQYSEDRFRKLLDATGNAIIVLRDETIVETNSHFADMFQPPQSTTMAGTGMVRFCELFLPDGGLTAREVRQHLALVHGGEKFNIETRLRRGNGSYFDAELSIAPLDHHGERLLLVVVQDISERKSSEAVIHALNAGLEVRVAERTAQLMALNEELESFSASISHDLRAPLHRISGFASLLLTDSENLAEQPRRQLGIITREASRMAVMIDDLLALAKLDRVPLRKSQVNLTELVKDARENVIGISEDAAGRDIRWTIDALPAVAADARLLQQVFINLLGNAVKYTRGMATASIQVGVASENADKDEVVIFVRDNGAGFDMQRAQNLFGVFERLHTQQEFEGTGVGLANVRRIIRRHGGRVWADAKPNEGATFFIGLPAAR